MLRHTLLKNGNREGTIETFKKIAAALRVDIDDIAQENRETVMSTLGRRLTQLAQLGGSFGDFARVRVSLIKGLGGA